MENPNENKITSVQKYILVIATIFLVATLSLFRFNTHTDTISNRLLERSLEPEKAFINGRPTIIEFYADWCEACNEMAPSMDKLSNLYSDQLNLVMLNIDNDRWLDYIEKYEVIGIPQLNLFDNKGDLLGKSIGFQSEEQLNKIFKGLIKDESLNNLPLVDGEISSISSQSDAKKILEKQTFASPRSHS